MTRRFSSSPSFLRLPIAALCVVTLFFLWGLYFQQKTNSHDNALNAKAAEHLNLANIVAENLRQLVDRAQAIGAAVHRGAGSLRPNQRRAARMLAEDPVFKRMSLFDRDGNLVSSSHADEPQKLPAGWLSQLREHTGKHGFRPFLPHVPQEQQVPSIPSWRLPFLLPLTDSSERVLDSILLVQLDIGYLANLFQHVDLGATGLMRLLDSTGQERLRISNSGVVVSGVPLLPAPLKSREETGRMTHYAPGGVYQSLYRQIPPRGFTVILSQQREEILATHVVTYGRQLWLNVGITLFILAALFWTFRVLRKRQEAFKSLEEAQLFNQQLIKQLEEEHRHSTHAATTDHLSGLHNRRKFLEIATPALVRQLSKRQLAAILFIDMDRFKSINDSLGHGIGDLLLQAVAGRISRLLEPEDEAARFGGDEFVVLLAGERGEEEIDNWVRVLVGKLSAVYSLNEHEVNTSPSVGVAICPQDGQDVDSLIRCADAAMYSAKQAGRGQYRYFDPSLNVSDVHEFILEQAFAGALMERQFVLHFQPQVRLDSTQVVGYEALVRWQHPEFGLLYPDRFILLAERCGFIVALGWEVLRLALEELKRWRAQGISAQLAVNVSVLQLRQADFSDRLLSALAAQAIEPHRLELEITETTVLDDGGVAIEHLHRLRRAGLGIALDDFGQGYAGFAHLQSLPLSKLKIDRALITPLSNSHDDSPIVSSTIILAKRLGLEVVAEGVETRAQVVYLKLAGCDIAQGFHFSRPMSSAQLRQYAPFINAMGNQCVQ